MWKQNNFDIVLFLLAVVLSVALIILGAMLGAMDMFNIIKGNVCESSYETKEEYMQCNALDVKDFTKKITVKE